MSKNVKVEKTIKQLRCKRQLQKEIVKVIEERKPENFHHSSLMKKLVIEEKRYT